MSFDNIISYASTLGGGFFVGVLIGYTLKKVIKLVAVIVGLFLAGLVYLQSQQIANINWNKLQTLSERAITTISNAIVIQIPGNSGVSGDSQATAAYKASIGLVLDDNVLTLLLLKPGILIINTLKAQLIYRQ